MLSFLFPQFFSLPRNISSIKSDLAPSLVRKQFRKPKRIHQHHHHKHNVDHQESSTIATATGAEDINTNIKTTTNDDDNDNVHYQHKHLLDFVKHSEMVQLLQKLESVNQDTPADQNTQPQPYPNSTIQCYALLVDSNSNDNGSQRYCIRANNWIRFCEANRVVLMKNKQEQSATTITNKQSGIKSYVDGIIGPGTSIGERCKIEQTIIGSNCKVGDRVRLYNCIVLDNVTIENDVTAQGSVICYDVTIGARAEIKECIIGPQQTLASLGK